MFFLGKQFIGYVLSGLCVAAVVAGWILGSVGVLFVVVCGVLMGGIFQERRLMIVVLCCGLAAFGGWRAVSVRAQYPHVSGAVRVSGSVASLPVTQNGRTTLLVRSDSPLTYTYSLSIRDASMARAMYGDQVRFTCTQASLNLNDSYHRYLAARGADVVCETAEVVSRNAGASGLLRSLYQLRLQIEQRMDRAFTSPTAELVRGIVLGNQQALPKDLRETMRIAGVTHIVALSGSNVVIIIAWVLAIITWLPVSRRAGLVLAGIFVIAFIVACGAPASVIRAGLMTGIAMCVRETGRRTNGFRVLLYTSAIVGIWTPTTLVYDAGFHLSLAATLGLLEVQPRLQSWWRRRVSKKKIPEVLSTSFSAQVTTTPVLVVLFHQLSIVSLLSNMLILPVIPVLMAVGVGGAVMGDVPIIGNVIGVLGNGIGSYVMLIAGWCASLPWATVTFLN